MARQGMLRRGIVCRGKERRGRGKFLTYLFFLFPFIYILLNIDVISFHGKTWQGEP